MTTSVSISYYVSPVRLVSSPSMHRKVKLSASPHPSTLVLSWALPLKSPCTGEIALLAFCLYKDSFILDLMLSYIVLSLLIAVQKIFVNKDNVLLVRHWFN